MLLPSFVFLSLNSKKVPFLLLPLGHPPNTFVGVHEHPLVQTCKPHGKIEPKGVDDCVWAMSSKLAFVSQGSGNLHGAERP